MDPIIVETAKQLSDAQSVQKVLAIFLAITLLVVVILARTLWNEVTRGREELKSMYKEQIETFKALKEDHK